MQIYTTRSYSVVSALDLDLDEDLGADAESSFSLYNVIFCTQWEEEEFGARLNSLAPEHYEVIARTGGLRLSVSKLWLGGLSKLCFARYPCVTAHLV